MTVNEPTEIELQAYSNQFDEACATRHAKGELEYGQNTWLVNDVYEMILEELADTANYARYLYMKLCVLRQMEEELRSNSESGTKPKVPQIGVKSFIPGVGRPEK